MNIFETWPAFHVGSFWTQPVLESSGDTQKTSLSDVVVSRVVEPLHKAHEACSMLIYRCTRNLMSLNLLLVSTIKQVASNIFQTTSNCLKNLGNLTGYFVGPAVSILGASLVRLSMGKRAPSAGPLYIAAFVATTILVTVWAIQFFKNPKFKKIMQDRGVKEAVTNALPFPKPKIVEPLHSRHVMSQDRIDTFLQIHQSISIDMISEAEAKNALAVYKQYCDWVKKKIRVDKANADTLRILQTTLNQHLTQVLKSLVIFGHRGLLEEFVGFNAKDPFVNRVYSKKEIGTLYHQFGSRLATILRKDDLIELFPAGEESNPERDVMDALMSSNTDRVMDITTTSVVDPFKIFIYGSKEDSLLDSINFKLPPLNLIQAAVLSGDTEGVKRLIASSSTQCDWSSKDSKGLSYLTLAALSGSKQMWDFVKEFSPRMPLIDDAEYLYLFYSSIKSNNLDIFQELYAPLFEEEYKDLIGTLILDLYEKAVSYGSNQIMKYLESNTPLENELKKAASIKTVFKASILGSHQALFDRYFSLWQKDAKDNSLSLKEAYECVLNSANPSEEILREIRLFEQTFSASYQTLSLDSTSFNLNRVLQDLSDESALVLLRRIPNQQLIRFIGEKGAFYNRIISRPRILDEILTLCSDAKFLVTACAKEAIKLGHLDTLSMLCSKGLDVVKKLPDSHESLLSYVMLSLNTDMINIILGHSPPLSQVLIAQLKERVTTLKCHKEDEAAAASIMRMLEAKSLERGTVLGEDPQVHLALVKAGAMEFAVDSTALPKEDASRGLVSAGLSFLGLL